MELQTENGIYLVFFYLSNLVPVLHYTLLVVVFICHLLHLIWEETILLLYTYSAQTLKILDWETGPKVPAQHKKEKATVYGKAQRNTNLHSYSYTCDRETRFASSENIWSIWMPQCLSIEVWIQDTWQRKSCGIYNRFILREKTWKISSVSWDICYAHTHAMNPNWVKGSSKGILEGRILQPPSHLILFHVRINWILSL